MKFLKILIVNNIDNKICILGKRHNKINFLILGILIIEMRNMQ